jgi:hypothetical protein
MLIVSLDSPPYEVPCLILHSMVYQDVTRQAKGVTPFEVQLERLRERTCVLEPV